MPTHSANRERIISADDARVVFRVADRHLPFARLLKELGLPLVAVPVDERLFLGVRCANEREAKRRTLGIYRAVKRRPMIARKLQSDLGLWRARAVGLQLTLWWPAIELWRHWMH